MKPLHRALWNGCRVAAPARWLLALACACIPVASHSAEPLALKKIMQDLGKDMQAATDGISREDYELIDKSARAIADHPQPPFMEKARVIAFIGTKIVKFKGYDEEAHDAALAMARAARDKDGQAAINAFQKIQSACFGCHAAFRKPFVEHFYGLGPTAAPASAANPAGAR